MARIRPNDRVLIEGGFNHYTYRIGGPGRVFIKPWEQIVSRFSVGVQFYETRLSEVRTADDIPLTIDVQVLYQVDEKLLTADFLPRLPEFAAGIWQELVSSATQQKVRQVIAGYSRHLLEQYDNPTRLQRVIKQALYPILEFGALRPVAVFLINIILPETLQREILNSQKETIHTLGRAAALSQYLKALGVDNLDQVMPHITRWEMLTTMRNRGDMQFWMTGAPWANDPNHQVYQPSLFHMPVYGKKDT